MLLGSVTAASDSATAAIGPEQTAVSLAVTDGYDSQSGSTLIQSGTLSYVLQSDNVRVDINGGEQLSFQFEGNLAAGTIQSVKVYVEYFSDNGMQPGNAILWEIGTGSLTSPTILQSFDPGLLRGANSEATVEWDVTASIDTIAEAEDMKLIIHNNSSGNKKVRVDRVYVQVTFN